MQSPFRRKPIDPVIEGPTDATDADGSLATVAGAKSRAYTPSKRELGRVTPKRKAGGRAVEPPPANRREALKRMRQKQREQRAEARAGMMAGKEEFLMARDRGPERALVRDIVDVRRNVASYFLFVMLIVLLGSIAQVAQLAVYATLFFYVYGLAVIVDSVLLTRRVSKLVTARFPKSTKPARSHYWYAIMRSLNFRRLRMPAPRVKVGDRV